jgi:DNA-binding PucR family transcriptional regulator
VDPGSADSHNAAPGLDPQGDLVVVVGRVSAADTSLSVGLGRAAVVLADQLATRRASPLLVVRDRAIVAVVPAEQQDPLMDRLDVARTTLAAEGDVALYCGISSPCAGFDGVAVAFEEASLAVSRSSEAYPVVTLGSLPALQHLLLGATRATRAVLLEKAAPLRDRRAGAEATVRETLHGFAAADMNISRAARALHIHENTLRYRLRRIRESSGHDPQTFAGLVELVCLLETMDGAALDGPSAAR